MGTAHDFKPEMTIIAGNSISTVAETNIFMQSVKTFKQSNKKNHNNHNPRKREGERRRLPDSLFIGEQSRVSAIRENEPLPRLEQSPCTGSTGLKA